MNKKQIFYIYSSPFIVGRSLRFYVLPVIKETKACFFIDPMAAPISVRQLKKCDSDVFTDGKEAAREFLQRADKKVAQLEEALKSLKDHRKEVADALKVAEKDDKKGEKE